MLRKETAKISHELEMQLVRLRALAKPQKIRVLVEFIRRPTVQALESARIKFMARIVYQSRVTPYVSVEVDVEQVEKIAALPSVRKVWHILRYYPLEKPAYFVPTEGASITLMETAKHMNIDVVKVAGYTGKNVLIVLVDSGVDKTHPMLEGKVQVEKSFHPDDPNPTDYMGHGTHCASTLAGKYWKDTVSGREFEGMAPDAMLINAKIFSMAGADADWIMQALEWSCEFRPQISSNSWGASAAYAPMRTLIAKLKELYGTIFVFAVGNTGPEYYSMGYPGGHLETVGVGSIAVKNPSPNSIAPFSSRGPNNLGETKPDVMAPGGVDTRDWRSAEEIVCAAGLNQGVHCTRGTSMSTPHIAGGLALLVEAGISNPVALLYSSAHDLVDFGKDNDTGFGVADFARALNLPLPNSHALTVEASISGVKFYVNGWVLKTPWSDELREATYAISVPKVVFVDSYVYEFTQWQDGELSPERTVNLTGDTVLKANYKRLNAHVIIGVENRKVVAAYPDHNPGPKFPDPIFTQALTIRLGETLPTRSFLKFNLANLPRGLTITGGRLHMRCYDLDVPRNIEVYVVEDDGWSEDTITWNNKPPLGTLLSTTQVDSKDAIYEWDITPFVKSEYLGDKIVSLCVKDAVEETTPSYYYTTQFEGVKVPKPPLGKNCPPYIIITYEAVGKGTLEVHAYAG